MLSVPRGQMVLDIGGGDGPFPRANVVCEKFITSDEERENVFLFDRPLVIGDIESLPFKDQSFDFVYCSHVLEHTSNPQKAVSELIRVAKRGYIEVPSEYLEYTAKNTASHLWTVWGDSVDGALVFTPKNNAHINPLVDKIYNEKLLEKDLSYMVFHFKNFYTLYNVRLHWEKSIAIKIKGGHEDHSRSGVNKGRLESVEILQKVLQPNRTSVLFKPRRWVKKIVQWFFCRVDISSWYQANLACPTCKTPFGQKPVDQLVCRICGTSYPVVNGCPVVLNEQAHPMATAPR
jgi:SAM-dependent methyltransferase/uncharacterized protein YbaR (Trm112 family)